MADERTGAEQIVDAWRVNNRANLLLLEHIPEHGLRATMSARGGRTVAQQLAHVHNVRLSWLDVCAPALAKGQKKIDPKAALTPQFLADRLTASGDAVADMLTSAIAAGGKVRGFPRGAGVLMGYLIAHDAHHRGNILLTLKLSNHPVDEAARLAIWEWGKI